MFEQVVECIETLLYKRKMSKSGLAAKLNITRQAVNHKLTKGNMTLKEMQELADAFDCNLKITFTMRDTGESFTATSEYKG